MSITTYPKVFSEQETLTEILKGKSIARYGDGEFKLCLNKPCISQIADSRLSRELRQILSDPHNPHCLVGIPNRGHDAKEYFWSKFFSRGVYQRMLIPNGKYYSSFITRPDSAPTIDVPEYWNSVISLWKDKDVTLAIGSPRSLTKERLSEARSVEVVTGPRRDAYAEIDRIEKEILAIPNQTVLLCLGATATALAYRLSKKGKHAIDLGHIGMFMKRKGFKYGDPPEKGVFNDSPEESKS